MGCAGAHQRGQRAGRPQHLKSTVPGAPQRISFGQIQYCRVGPAAQQKRQTIMGRLEVHREQSGCPRTLQPCTPADILVYMHSGYLPTIGGAITAGALLRAQHGGAGTVTHDPVLQPDGAP